MKKFIALMLSAAVCFSVTACGGKKDDESSSAAASVTVEEATEEITDGDFSEEEAQRSDVLVDNEYCQVVYGGLEYTEDNVRMTLSVLNKTDKKIGIAIKDIVLDGIMSGMTEERSIEANQTEDMVCFVGYDYQTVSCGLENKDISIIEFCINV